MRDSDVLKGSSGPITATTIATAYVYSPRPLPRCFISVSFVAHYVCSFVLAPPLPAHPPAPCASRYSSGSLCDLGSGVSAPRSVSVRYWCPTSPQSAANPHARAVAQMGAVKTVGVITSVVEEETCAYTISVASALACAHPAMTAVAAVDVPVSAVRCVPRSSLAGTNETVTDACDATTGQCAGDLTGGAVAGE